MFDSYLQHVINMNQTFQLHVYYLLQLLTLRTIDPSDY
jgi:hypothetical protein